MSIVRSVSCCLTVLFLAGCGGASEQRIQALEAQVRALEQAQAQTDEKVGAASASAGQTEQLAQMLEVLQREVTKASDKIAEVASRSGTSAPVIAAAPPAPAPAPAPAPVAPVAPAAPPASDGPAVSPSAVATSPGADRSRVNEQVSLILGVGAKGLAVQGPKYTMRLAWLVQQLDAFAANEKGYPKLVTNKKAEGLVVRGIKPGTLPARLGLVNNDLLVSLNGKPLASADELASALTNLAAENRLIVRRKTKELALEYRLAP